jgi:tetratricopeptide (TPR) repeat protein
LRIGIKSKLLKGEKIGSEANNLWDAAWNDEKNGNRPEANEKFQKSFKGFEKASELVPSNFEYEQLMEVSSLKIEGNKLYDEGINLLGEANQLRKKHKYQEARNKFEKALEKFQQGFNASDNDRRFKRSIELTETHIQEINNEIKGLQLSSEQDETSKTKPEVAQEKTEGVFETLE